MYIQSILFEWFVLTGKREGDWARGRGGEVKGMREEGERERIWNGKLKVKGREKGKGREREREND